MSPTYRAYSREKDFREHYLKSTVLPVRETSPNMKSRPDIVDTPNSGFEKATKPIKYTDQGSVE